MLSHRTPHLARMILLFSLLLNTVALRAEPADWVIDAEHFSIAFGVGHVGYQQQLGLFLTASGSFRYDPDTRQLDSGRVEVAADSLFTNHQRRDDHLRGRDFLDAGNHPLIVFEATGYHSDGPGESGADSSSPEAMPERGMLTGNLTLLGRTLPVTLDVTINRLARYPFGHRRETLGVSAQTTILRSEWGMDYGVADNLVGDAVALRFELEAIRQ